MVAWINLRRITRRLWRNVVAISPWSRPTRSSTTIYVYNDSRETFVLRPCLVRARVIRYRCDR